MSDVVPRELVWFLSSAHLVRFYVAGSVEVSSFFLPHSVSPFLKHPRRAAQRQVWEKSILRTSEPSRLSSSPERKPLHPLRGQLLPSCQCRTCHIQPNRLNISLPLSQFNPPTPTHPPAYPPPGWFLSCFQTYGCLAQFVSPSTAVSSAGHSDCSMVNTQQPWDGHVTLHVRVFFCAVVVGGAAGCPLLNQPCRVDSAHRALRAVNNSVSAKGSQTQTGRWRQSLPPCLHILTQNIVEETEAGGSNRAGPDLQKLGVRTAIKRWIRRARSRETICCSQRTMPPRI